MVTLVSMPVHRIASADPSTAALEDVETRLGALLREHLARVNRVRVERRGRGPASGPLPEEVVVELDADENPESVIAEIVAETMRIVLADARRPRGANTPKAGQVGAWQGRIVLVELGAKKPEVQHLDVAIEDPDAVTTIDGESIAVVNVVRVFLKDMTQQMVAVMGAAASRESAMATLVEAVAKSVGHADASRAKWDFKIAREREETARVEAQARTDAAKTRARWDAFETAAEEYKDVVEVWSKYFTGMTKRKPGEPPPDAPKRPTADELARVLDGWEAAEHHVELGGERVTLRGTMAAMIAEPDARRRHKLAKLLAELLGRYTEQQRAELKARMLNVLGMERALEIGAWLSLPLT